MLVYIPDVVASEVIAGLDARGARRFGPPGREGRTATGAALLPGRSPAAWAEALGERGIAVAAGHAYAERLTTDHLDRPDGVLRISLAHYSDRSDLAALFGALDDLA